MVKNCYRPIIQYVFHISTVGESKQRPTSPFLAQHYIMHVFYLHPREGGGRGAHCHHGPRESFNNTIRYGVIVPGRGWGGGDVTGDVTAVYSMRVVGQL